MSGTRTVEFCARRRTPRTTRATASQIFRGTRRDRFGSIRIAPSLEVTSSARLGEAVSLDPACGAPRSSQRYILCPAETSGRLWPGGRPVLERPTLGGHSSGRSQAPRVPLLQVHPCVPCLVRGDGKAFLLRRAQIGGSAPELEAICLEDQVPQPRPARIRCADLAAEGHQRGRLLVPPRQPALARLHLLEARLEDAQEEVVVAHDRGHLVEAGPRMPPQPSGADRVIEPPVQRDEPATVSYTHLTLPPNR